MKKTGKAHLIKPGGIRLNIGQIGIMFVFIFFFSYNAFWGYELFLKTNIVPAIASLFPLMLIVLHFSLNNSRVNIRLFILVLAIYLVIVIRSSFNLKDILYYGLCISILLYGDIYKTGKVLKLFSVFAIICVIGTFFNYMFGDIYGEVILPLFKSSSNYASMVSWNKYKVTFPGFMSQTAVNAAFLVLGIGYFVCEISVRKRLTLKNVLVLFVLFASLVLTNKRAHFLFLFAAFVLVYYFCGNRTQRAKRFVVIALTICLGLVALETLSAHVNIGVFKKLSQTIENASMGKDITSGRIDLYKRAFELFSEQPVFGIGWEEYKTIAFDVGKYVGFATHNIYLQLLCEVGIIGAIPFVIFFAYAYNSAIKINFLAQDDEEKLVARFCLFVQSFFLLYGLTGNPLYDVCYYIPYFVICAYSFSLRQKAKDRIITTTCSEVKP